MDMVEYELVASIEAGGTPFMFPDEYLMARLLQLRARGLVRFVTPEDGDYLPGSLELTEAGRAWLARRRPLLSQAAPGIGRMNGAAHKDKPDRPERRRARLAPRGKLWPGRLTLYPALLPHPWYPLQTAVEPHPTYVWLRTAHGMTRVRRSDVELRGMPSS